MISPNNNQPLLPPDFFADHNYLPAKQGFMLMATQGLVEMADEMNGPDRADLASNLIGDLMETIALTEDCRFTVPSAYERLPQLRAAQATLSQWL